MIILQQTFFVHVIGKTMPTTALWTEAIAEPVLYLFSIQAIWISRSKVSAD